MITTKNLQVNKEAVRKRRNKKIKYKLVIAAFTATIAAGSIVGINKIKSNNEKQQIQTIVNYYGKESEENKVVDYIELSEKLNSMKLSNYSADEDLFNKYNISNELKSPEEINDLIETAKTFNQYISSKNLKTQSSNIETFLNLIMQEKLVNDYIYTTGYFTAQTASNESTKKYAGEVFGITDYNNIKFDYNISPSTGESDATVSYKTDEGTKKYTFNNFWISDIEKDIKDGVKAMNNADNSYDKDAIDNDEYNKQRNKLIKEALEQSAILGNKVEEEDLYSEKLANKLR